jgi:F0F1-type ATP synthase delta subunit
MLYVLQYIIKHAFLKNLKTLFFKKQYLKKLLHVYIQLRKLNILPAHLAKYDLLIQCQKTEINILF